MMSLIQSQVGFKSTAVKNAMSENSSSDTQAFSSSTYAYIDALSVCTEIQ